MMDEIVTMRANGVILDLIWNPGSNIGREEEVGWRSHCSLFPLVCKNM